MPQTRDDTRTRVLWSRCLLIYHCETRQRDPLTRYDMGLHAYVLRGDDGFILSFPFRVRRLSLCLYVYIGIGPMRAWSTTHETSQLPANPNASLPGGPLRYCRDVACWLISTSLCGPSVSMLTAFNTVFIHCGSSTPLAVVSYGLSKTPMCRAHFLRLGLGFGSESSLVSLCGT